MPFRIIVLAVLVTLLWSLVTFLAEGKKTQSSSANNRRISAKKPTNPYSNSFDQRGNSDRPEEAADDDDEEMNQANDDNPLNILFETIFGAYHKELVPRRPTVVRLDLVLIKVKSTNEREGIFETVVTLLMEWQDKRLSWDPLEFGNVTVLAFDSDRVWLPDIAMTNSADHLYSISKDTRFVIRLSSDGTMKFVPTGTARTWCDLKLLTFPFDKQTCSFEFESWSMDSSWMTINKSSSPIVDASFSSPQWALCDHFATVYDHYYEFSDEYFTRARFDFVVRRKSTFYIINLIFPCATLSMIQLMVFLIPSTDSTSDRISFGTTNLLTLVVFQTIVTEEMPKSSDSVTALSKYIIALIVISAVGILEAVAAERLLRPRATPPPWWMLKIMMKLPLLWESQLPSGIGGMVLQLWSSGKHLKDEKRPPVQSKVKNLKKSKKSSTWLADESLPRIECFCKKGKNFKDAVVTMAINKQHGYEHCFVNGNCCCYEGSLRRSPSPVFGANGTLKFERFPDDKNSFGKLRRDSLGGSISSDFDGEEVVESDIIEIGKMWGDIVTRLDGLLFILCTLCVVILPIFLFVPVAVHGEICQ